jgi:hypothetical protein
MANGMYDDLGCAGFVENEIGVRQRRHAPDNRIVRAGSDAGIEQQKINDDLNVSLNVARTLRRMGIDIVEN